MHVLFSQHKVWFVLPRENGAYCKTRSHETTSKSAFHLRTINDFTFLPNPRLRNKRRALFVSSAERFAFQGGHAWILNHYNRGWPKCGPERVWGVRFLSHFFARDGNQIRLLIQSTTKRAANWWCWDLEDSFFHVSTRRDTCARECAQHHTPRRPNEKGIDGQQVYHRD